MGGFVPLERYPPVVTRTRRLPPPLGSFCLHLDNVSSQVRLRMPMFDLWQSWIDASPIAAEAQCVVALRMMRFAGRLTTLRRRKPADGG
jgi:hypothetical protein